jgi:hypothetical protein
MLLPRRQRLRVVQIHAAAGPTPGTAQTQGQINIACRVTECRLTQATRVLHGVDDTVNAGTLCDG